jgi:hypothetical protein
MSEEPIKTPRQKLAEDVQDSVTSGTKSLIEAINKFAAGVNYDEPDLFSVWEQYKARVEKLRFKSDELPPIKKLSDMFSNPPALSPVLIDGLLRRGHQLAINAPSKAGKSFLLIALGLSFSFGKPWLGFSCTKCKVLFINFEIDEASFFWRINKLAEALNLDSKNVDIDNFSPWTLRGYNASMESLLPKLIDKIKSTNYDAVILDPLYKLFLSEKGVFDENSAGGMALLFTELDKISKCGCSLIWAGHYSKGSSAAKDPIDRVSGSGVLGRAPDAIITLSELELPPLISGTGYRLETILREFPSDISLSLKWNYPLHEVDPDLDIANIKKKNGAGKKSITISDMQGIWLSKCTKDGYYPLSEMIKEIGKGCFSTFERVIKSANTSNSNKYSLKIINNHQTFSGVVPLKPENVLNDFLSENIPKD